MCIRDRFMREYRRLMLVTVLVVMSVLVFSATPQASQASDAWSVEIVSGKNIISLTQAEMENMPTVIATAGFRKSGGKVEGPFDYKGVYMKDLLDKVETTDKAETEKKDDKAEKEMCIRDSCYSEELVENANSIDYGQGLWLSLIHI